MIPCEQAATLGDTGDIILGSFDKGYLYAQKGGIKSATSIHVLFESDQNTFRFTMRLDGSPLLRSGITPFKGSDALSHFVKLDAR